MTAAGSPHSETLGSKPARRLPEAYRCPPRLSSVPSAKASTIRPCRQPHTRGNPQDQTNTGRQIINTLRSQNDQTNNQTPKTGTRSKYISTSRPQPATPKKGRPRGPLASTLQFSNHHATPHTPTRRQPDRNPWRAPERQPPDKEGRGGQGTQQHAHTRPHNRDATILPRQHARHPREKTPGTMPGKQ